MTDRLFGAPSPASPRVCVLVVDGNDIIRGVLSRALARIDCEAVEAHGAVHARALCSGRPVFAAAIVEVDLPDGSGLELLGQLRDLLGDRAPPIVIFASEPPRPRPTDVVAVLEKSAGVRGLLPILSTLLATFRGADATHGGSKQSVAAAEHGAAPPSDQETKTRRLKLGLGASTLPQRGGDGPKRAGASSVVEEIVHDRGRDPRRER